MALVATSILNPSPPIMSYYFLSPHPIPLPKREREFFNFVKPYTLTTNTF
ncbi:hypothetical protein A45J_2328 [hot springs metagenome]|uniref:Uncharacterized protein n=1 Tax=hot springs metagenome TaxID=433727 RepID=A0A5J4KZ87_9ZZZZ